MAAKAAQSVGNEIPIEFFATDAPPQKDYAQLVYVGNDIFWLVCGYSGRFKVNPATPHSYHSAIFAFNRKRASWTRKPFAPGHAERLPPLTAHAATVYDTPAGPRVAVFGGAWIGKDDEEEGKTAKFSTNDAFILRENGSGQIEVQVIEGAEVLVGRPESTFAYPPQGLYFASARAGDTFYIVAGQSDEDCKTSPYFNSCWPLKFSFDAHGNGALDIKGRLLPADTEFPVRAAATASCVRDSLYIIGGQYQRRAVNDVFQIDPRRHLVKRVTPKGPSVALPPCAWHVESSSGTHVYVVGGGLGPFVYRLDTVRGTWERSVEGHEALAGMVMGACGCTVDGELWCYGGLQQKKYAKTQLLRFRPSDLHYTTAAPPERVSFGGERKRPAPGSSEGGKKKQKKAREGAPRPQRASGAEGPDDDDDGRIDIVGGDGDGSEESGEDSAGARSERAADAPPEPPLPSPAAQPAHSSTRAGEGGGATAAPALGVEGGGGGVGLAVGRQALLGDPLQQAAAGAGPSSKPPGAGRTVAECLAEVAPEGLPPEMLKIDRVIRAAVGDLIPYESHGILCAAIRPLCTAPSSRPCGPAAGPPGLDRLAGERHGDAAAPAPAAAGAAGGQDPLDLALARLADRAATARNREAEAEAAGGRCGPGGWRPRRCGSTRGAGGAGGAERAPVEAARAHLARLRGLVAGEEAATGLFAHFAARVHEALERARAAAKEVAAREARAREALQRARQERSAAAAAAAAPAGQPAGAQEGEGAGAASGPEAASDAEGESVDVKAESDAERGGPGAGDPAEAPAGPGAPPEDGEEGEDDEEDEEEEEGEGAAVDVMDTA
eukprot:tig00000900_g5377.t1